MNNTTPGKAVRRFCVDCVGGEKEKKYVKVCGGDKCLNGQGDAAGVCYLFPYRLRKGRPSVRTIRRFCTECAGGGRDEVTHCPVPDCALYPYRMATNPKRKGMGSRSNLVGVMSGGFAPQSRTSLPDFMEYTYLGKEGLYDRRNASGEH